MAVDNLTIMFKKLLQSTEDKHHQTTLWDADRKRVNAENSKSVSK